MLISLGVVEPEEIVVFEQKGGRAGSEAYFVHWHAGFEIVGDAVD